MQGYYADEKATIAKLDNEGWLRSEDMGYFDNEGYLFIVGRKQDILLYLHHSISPIDIESVIEKHKDICRASVVGVSVPIFNDIPAALCTKLPNSTLTSDELQSWLEGNIGKL